MIVPYVVADIFRLTIEPICSPLVVKHYSSSPVEDRHPYPGLLEQSVSPLAERPTWQHALLLYFWQLMFMSFSYLDCASSKSAEPVGVAVTPQFA